MILPLRVLGSFRNELEFGGRPDRAEVVAHVLDQCGLQLLTWGVPLA